MDIRVLTEDDAASFRELRLRALREHPESFGASWEDERTRTAEFFAQRLRTEAAAPDRFVLGAFPERELVGIVQFRRGSGEKTRHVGSVTAMYVAAESRGRHLGRALMEELIGRASALEGLEQINLSVVTDNTAAVHLYQSLGFEPFGLEQRALKWQGRYFDLHWMALRLRAVEA